MMFRKEGWNPAEIEEVIQHSREHLNHRQSQLNGMVQYAESNACRREIILKHFGDTGAAESADCCDNCQVRKGGAEPRPNANGKEPEQMNHGERAALVILDCIRRLKIRVGKGKLAQILHGSQAQDIIKFQHDKNVYYRRLAAVKQADIENLIEQLTALGYIKIIGSEYPVVSLTPRGESAIREKAVIALKVPGSFDETRVRHAKAKLEAGGTLEYTARLFKDGLKAEQIAKERGLTVTTIYGHLAQLIESGTLNVEQVVTTDKREKIEQAIAKVGSTQYLTPIKMLLPDEIDYNTIRCVVAGRQTEQNDAVSTFLNASHPRPLTGPWHLGWSLGFHSRFSGGDWVRSGIGDLTYRLKYEGDSSVLPELLAQTLNLLQTQPDLIKVDAILPVPPSQSRAIDPVLAFCRDLAEKTGLTVQTSLAKTRVTQPQKSLHTLAQKRANVAEAFSLRGEVRNRRLLVVDDLFDSGATLEEITRLLQRNGAARVNVLTLTRTIHANL